MGKIRQWVKRLSVKKKLIFYGYLTITPVLVCTCGILLFHNYKTGMQERTESNLASVDTLADSIQVFQTEVKDFSTYICINHDIYTLLTTDDVTEKNSNAKLWLEEAPMQIVQDMIALKGDIKTIAIYPENGIRPYLRCMDNSAYLSDTATLHDTAIYHKTLDSENGMVWEYVPRNSGEIYLANYTDKIVLHREIFDLTQKKTLGYIAIGVSADRLRKLCENTIQTEGAGVLVLDKNGGELCRAGSLDPDVEKYLKSDEFVEIHYKNRKPYFSYGKYDIVCNQKGRNTSIVCMIVPRFDWKEQILSVINMPIALLLGMLVGLLPLLLIISNAVTKPLQRVSAAIRKFSAGDFEQQVEVSTYDEVGEVAVCFNKMVDDIRTLIDENYVMALREKESELNALQAQINPHFLYNTLDSLYWQATEAGNDEIAEMILALSQLFRLVLGRGESEVAVSHEIELISRYLQIQKMRFGRRFDYEISVAPEMENIRIPKLLLQPFVENAIVHGFENVSVPCKLRVSGSIQGGYLHFEVSDTGVGMSSEQIAAIWEEETDQYAKQRIGRYAIKNIRERLQLRYRDDFRLEIHSVVGEGTTVILILPCEKEEEECR